MIFGINTTRDISRLSQISLAREITYNNFEIWLVVFIPNITTNHAITYTNLRENLNAWGGERLLSGSGVGLVGVREFVG